MKLKSAINMNDLVAKYPAALAAFKETGSGNERAAYDASLKFAKALQLPLNQGILYGDIRQDLFQAINFEPGVPIEFPVDAVGPDDIKDHVAYTIPNQGRIPERQIEPDVLTIRPYRIANSIDWLLRFSEYGRVDVAQRGLEVFRAGFVKKMNDDAFHLLLKAGVDRNIVVYDSFADPGAFTKRLISLMQQLIRRQSGGNGASTNRGRLTDLFLSPELIYDMRNWTSAEVDEVTRSRMMNTEEGVLSSIYGTNLREIDELGVDQQYNEFYLNELGGTLASGDEELLIGVDRTDPGVFVMPTRGGLEFFPDPALHRFQRAGYYGWLDVGFGLLNGRAVVLGSA